MMPLDFIIHDDRMPVHLPEEFHEVSVDIDDLDADDVPELYQDISALVVAVCGGLVTGGILIKKHTDPIWLRQYIFQDRFPHSSNNKWLLPCHLSSERIGNNRCPSSHRPP